MTHEYIIALGGRVHTLAVADAGIEGDADTQPASAIAWAADHVLAVGPDEVVRGISRGDSIFLDLDGCVVTAAAATAPPGLEVGSPADLDIWDADPLETGAEITSRDAPRIVARVRAGAFTEGDGHCGPFRRL